MKIWALIGSAVYLKDAIETQRGGSEGVRVLLGERMIHCLMCISLGVDWAHINGDMIYWSLQELLCTDAANVAEAIWENNILRSCFAGTGAEVKIDQINTDHSLRSWTDGHLMTAIQWKHKYRDEIT